MSEFENETIEFEKYDVRGFRGLRFRDRYNTACSLQESSLMFEACIWLGAHEGHLLEDASSPHPPEKRPLLARMHLTQDHVRALLPLLQHFAETGELPDEPEVTR